MTELCTLKIVPDGPVDGSGLEKISSSKHPFSHIANNIKNLDGFQPSYGLNESAIPDDGRIRYHITVCPSSSRSAPFNRRLRFAFRSGTNVHATNIPLLPYPNPYGCIIEWNIRDNYGYGYPNGPYYEPKRFITLPVENRFTTDSEITITNCNSIWNMISYLNMMLATFLRDDCDVWDHVNPGYELYWNEYPG